MNIASPFIRRPVGTCLLTAAIVLAGIAAYLQLPVAPLPNVDLPIIVVEANLPGASPAIVASSIAAPLERQFGHIAGLTQMTSQSTLGATSVVLQFDLSRDINGAVRDVQAAINAARANLPSNLPRNPSWWKVNPSGAPVMIIALTSDIYGRGAMYDAADSVIKQRLLQIEGVGQINIGGGALHSVRVDVNPTLLNSFGLSLEDVRNVLAAQNANLAKGQITDGRQSADILDNDQLFKASDYKSLIVTYTNGAAVRLSDIANVQDSIQNIRVAGYVNGKDSVPLIIFATPGANIINTVDDIKAALPFLKASIPKGMNMDVTYDRSPTIRSSVHVVEGTLCIAIILVILVVFIFLRNPRTILIPAVVVPTSLVATFGVMYLLGYSVDNLSLMALVVSTGFVVDDAIVVIENISRHAEAGMAPREAALKGAREVTFTVISISISLVVVFAPILLMGGIVGRFMREFAATLSTAILVSLVISLTTTPMLSSYLIRYRKDQKHNWFYRASDQSFAWLHEQYRRSLKVILKHPAITLVVLLLTIVANFILYIYVPKGWFPEQDNGTVFGNIVGDQNSSYLAMRQVSLRLSDIATNDPAVENAVAFTGGNGGPANQGFIYLTLKPFSERKITSAQVINRLRPKFDAVPGASVFLQAGGGQYQYTIQSDNLGDLNKWGPVLLTHMQKLDGLTDVNSDQQNENNGLQASVIYDRNTAARLGISPQLIDRTIYDAFGQEEVSTMYTPLNQYYVIMEVEPQFWQDPRGLNQIYLHAANRSSMIPLGAVAHYVYTNAPLSVNHIGQFPSVTISYNLRPGFALGKAVKEIDQMEQSLGMPSSIHKSALGNAADFQSFLGNELSVVLISLFTVYVVLGILYESYVHPITILSTLPSAGVGALLALLLFNTEFSVIALIGVLLLIGIVKKNAILMVDFAISAEREQKLSPHEAIYEACVLRFRPIMMTTAAAMFGALPLVISNGMGSELRRPLGITIVGGLVLSQLLTLFTTPVVYLYFDRLRLWWQARRQGRKGVLRTLWGWVGKKTVLES
ncbi:MAG TPA: efflux RND transporter permease subunit [Verrucomicrobiae bacterium]|nr:efflux RND transporter permease subunit [Verrucomicrobiae bacterium]